jgi:hypothetical protein
VCADFDGSQERRAPFRYLTYTRNGACKHLSVPCTDVQPHDARATSAWSVSTWYSEALLSTRYSSRLFHCSTSLKHHDLHVCSPSQSSKAIPSTSSRGKRCTSSALSRNHPCQPSVSRAANRKVSIQISHKQSRRGKFSQNNIPSAHSSLSQSDGKDYRTNLSSC